MSDRFQYVVLGEQLKASLTSACPESKMMGGEKGAAGVHLNGQPAMGEDLTSSAAKAPSFHLEHLVTGGAALLVASLVGNGLNYLLLMFLARRLGVGEFGLYVLGVTIFNTTLLLMSTGVDSGIMKFVSERLAGRDPAGARGLVMTVVLFGGGVGMLAALVLGGIASPLAGQVYGQVELTGVLWGMAVAVPFALSNVLFLATLQAYHVIRYTVWVKYVWEPIGKWATAALALWIGWGVMGVVGGMAAVAMVSALTTGWALFRISQTAGSPTESSEVRLPGVSELRRLGAFCLPLLAANLFGVVAPRLDVLVLGYWASHDVAGIYSAAFQTAAALALILGAFDVVFAPTLSRAWVHRDRPLMQDSYEAVHRVALLVAVPACLVLIVFAPEVLALFGPAFTEGAPVLIVLVLAQLAHCAVGSANTVLLMSGATRLVLVNTLLYGVGLTLLLVVLIPPFGLVGAAGAAACGSVAIDALRVLQVRRRYALGPLSRDMVAPLAAGFAVGVLLLAIKGQVAMIWYLPLAVAASLLYLTLLGVWGVAERDRAVLRGLLARLSPA